MRGRGSSPQTRNHYRSVLRGLYRTALLPAYRVESGVTVNPFRDVPREAVMERMVTISLDDLRSWLANASYHVRLAVAIAALAPKLRLANVLALTWKEHVDPGPIGAPGCGGLRGSPGSTGPTSDTKTWHPSDVGMA